MVHSQKVQVESALLFETPEEIFARVFRQLRPRTTVPEIDVRFCRFADANSNARYERQRLSVRITDLLEAAPAPVIEALAYLLLCKLFRRPAPRAYSHRYRLYLNRRDVRRTLLLVRQTRGRKHLSGAKGTCHDLDKVFEELNQTYFQGLMTRPTLSWSRQPSRTILGHYDPSHNAIIVSKLLDRVSVPRVVLEYVLYHEMLHLRHPEEHKGSRRRIHTREFRNEEKSFTHLKEAKDFLKRL